MCDDYYYYEEQRKAEAKSEEALAGAFATAIGGIVGAGEKFRYIEVRVSVLIFLYADLYSGME